MPNYEKSLYQIELICIFHDLTRCQTTCVSIALYHELMCKGDSDALLMAGLKRVSPELSDLLGLWLLCFGSFPKFGIEETQGEGCCYCQGYRTLLNLSRSQSISEYKRGRHSECHF